MPDADWTLTRYRAGIQIATPMGRFSLNAEDGRIGGDCTAMDAFHLGGLNAGLVPMSLDMNRIQQAALPGYQQVGDRMRKIRASYGHVGYLYYERAAVWFSDAGAKEYLRVAGAELKLEDLPALAQLRSVLGHGLSFSLGLHRPLDGEMKNRTVFTVNFLLKM